MYIFTNALQNLGRNKGRNILLGLVMFAIIITTVVCLVINSTTNVVIDDYKNRFGSKITISPDYDKLMADNNLMGLTRITPEQYASFADSQYIMETQYYCELQSYSETTKAVGDGEDSNAPQMQQLGPDGKESDLAETTMKVIGSNDTSELPDFTNGKRQIYEGEMYDELGECIVSREFAELNNLSLGDTVRVKSILRSVQQTLEMTVVGIYYDTTDEYGNMPFKAPFANRRNELMTSFDTIAAFSNDGYEVNATMYLNNPDDLAAFESEIRTEGLSKYYKVSTDEASYKKIVGPVEGLSSISITFMIVVLVLGAIILILLSSIAIRERKYEVGVLRAMGMKKGLVACGLLFEMLSLTIICLVIGLSVGIIAAQPVADTLLLQQVEAAQNSNDNSAQGNMIMIGGSRDTSASVEALSEIDVRLNGDAVIQIICIALALAAVASVVGISFITRYEPIKILMERN